MTAKFAYEYLMHRLKLEQSNQNNAYNDRDINFIKSYIEHVHPSKSVREDDIVRSMQMNSPKLVLHYFRNMHLHIANLFNIQVLTSQSQDLFGNSYEKTINYTLN